MSICNGDWRSEWDNDLNVLLQRAEDAELSLSYLSHCGTEAARKQIGSYYTPADAAMFFWNEFMALYNLDHSLDICKFWNEHHFIEPASGAGALIFALLKKSVQLGLPLKSFASTEITIVDTNLDALNFVRDQLQKLAKKWKISLSGVHYICADFLECTLPISPRKPLFFGNPPFVANPKGSIWKNLFANFLERALRQSGPEGKVHFILPVSIAFSRDYERLRSAIRASGKSIALSSFDNIPDTLFPSGKPAHTNTNKANSQRCSIITIFPSDGVRVLSTRMHRWSKKDRFTLLSSRPQYHDVTEYSFDNQFPRPESTAVLRYLSEGVDCKRFETLITKSGAHTLYVAAVARNFIGFREEGATGVHCFTFATKQDLYTAVLILSSDLFLDYWRTVGDGFHLTRSNIMDFPLHSNLLADIVRSIPKGRRMWGRKFEYAKSKRHPNGMTTSYDFSPVALKISSRFDCPAQN